MKICVAGLWHLGVVTAACVADAGHRVVAFDEDASVVVGSHERRSSRRRARSRRTRTTTTRRRIPPLHRPTRAGAARARTWSGSPTTLRSMPTIGRTSSTCSRSAEASSRQQIRSSVMLISSQLPVGSTRLLEQSSAPGRTLAYSPENLRLGDAIAAFTQPERIVVGIRPDGDRQRIEELLGTFSDRIEWMGVESAELVKHGVNAFLATVDRVRERACGHRGAGRCRRSRSRARAEDGGPDRASRLRQAGWRIRRGHARAGHRLLDADR